MSGFDYILLFVAVGTVVLCIMILGAMKDSSRRMMQVIEVISALKQGIDDFAGSGSTVAAATGDGGGTGSSSEVMEKLQKHDKNFSIIASTLSAFQTSADKGFKRVDQDMNRIESLVTGMRDYLSESNQHMVRLQEGYDYSVLKRIVKPVIQVANGLESLETRLSKKSESEEVRVLWLDLLDSLEQNGIERLRVEENDDFSKIRKMAEATSAKEPTTDPEKVGTVAQVVRPGYCYVYNQDKRRLVVPAQVKLYEKVEG